MLTTISNKQSHPQARPEDLSFHQQKPSSRRRKILGSSPRMTTLSTPMKVSFRAKAQSAEDPEPRGQTRIVRALTRSFSGKRSASRESRFPQIRECRDQLFPRLRGKYGEARGQRAALTGGLRGDGWLAIRTTERAGPPPSCESDSPPSSRRCAPIHFPRCAGAEGGGGWGSGC